MGIYVKTAKDLAHEKEVTKLKSKIIKLQEEVGYWKNAANKANECSNHFEELYLDAIEHLDMTKEEFEKHIKNTEAAASVIKLIDTFTI